MDSKSTSYPFSRVDLKRSVEVPDEGVVADDVLFSIEDDTLQPVAAILCPGGADVIQKEAWSFYRTISGVRLCWELKEPKGPKGREPTMQESTANTPLWQVRRH